MCAALRAAPDMEDACMSLTGRLENLKQRHTSVDDQLHSEEVRPRPDAELVSRLKREKLRLKDEMSRLQA
jgi:hypothetical protein